MKGNYIAKNMNKINRNSVHISTKDKLADDPDYWIDEGIQEYKEETEKNIEKSTP